MPVYTYRCQTCGVQLEKTQKFDDRPLTRCPECRKGRLRRVPQPSSIVFKGSGWYATDHRSASGQGAIGKDEGSSDKTESTPDKSASTPDKADSQPAVKEEKSINSDGMTEQSEGRPRAGGSHNRGARNNQPKRPVA